MTFESGTYLRIVFIWTEERKEDSRSRLNDDEQMNSILFPVNKQIKI